MKALDWIDHLNPVYTAIFAGVCLVLIAVYFLRLRAKEHKLTNTAIPAENLDLIDYTPEPSAPNRRRPLTDSELTEINNEAEYWISMQGSTL